jgi:hypothetical protein
MSTSLRQPARQSSGVPRLGSAARWALRLLVGLAVTVTAAGAVVDLVLGSMPPVQAVVFAAATVSFLAVGAVMIERRPGNRVGPLLLLLGVAVGSFLVLDAWIHAPGPPPGVAYAGLVVTVMDGPLFFLLAMLFLSFPDGRLPSPRWRWLVIATGVLALAVFAGSLLRGGTLPYYAWLENPLSPPATPAPAAYETAYLLLVIGVALAALSLVVRWRRAGAVERAQIKWAAAAALLVAFAMITYGGTAGPAQYSEVGDLAVGVALGLFPIAIGIAVLRYRLYEIDRIISRTIGWALVTGILVAVFAGTVIGLQAALAPVTENNTLAIAGSTLLAAALFAPVRSRVQRAVDRRFNRARVDAQRDLEAFTTDLRDVVDLGAVEEMLAATVGRTVQPRGVAVWTRAGGTER